MSKSPATPMTPAVAAALRDCIDSCTRLARLPGLRRRKLREVRQQGAPEAARSTGCSLDGMETTFKLEASSPAAPRKYVLLVSGTMNPPHQGHVRLGLRAADALRAEGHTVSAVCFVPVHNNYMHNKAATQGSGPLFYPMERRCAMLQALVTAEGAAAADLCHVIDHEGEHSEELLEESPGYWAPKLPGGYLRTVPTVRLIRHFARTSPHMQAPGVRLGLVFGVDNLAGMAPSNPAANPSPAPSLTLPPARTLALALALALA